MVSTPPQVIYSLHSSRERSSSLKLLLGAGRGDDVAGSLNPAAGRGLTHLTRFGAAPHQRVCGSGLGGAWRAGRRTHAAAAHLISGEEVSAFLNLCVCSSTAIEDPIYKLQESHLRLHEPDHVLHRERVYALLMFADTKYSSIRKDDMNIL